MTRLGVKCQDMQGEEGLKGGLGVTFIISPPEKTKFDRKLDCSITLELASLKDQNSLQPCLQNEFHVLFYNKVLSKNYMKVLMGFRSIIIRLHLVPIKLASTCILH